MKLPAQPPGAKAPTVGRWIWTCRASFEPYLYEELAWRHGKPVVIGPGLVESNALPSGTPFPAFARAGFKIDAVVQSEDELVGAVAEKVKELVGRAEARPDGHQRNGFGDEAAEERASEMPRGSPAEKPGPTSLHVHAWASDTDAGNALADEVRAVSEQVAAALGRRAVDSFALVRNAGGKVLQLCIVSTDIAAIGLQHPTDALSPAPGGRHRMWRESSTSRAAMKLEEALESLPIAPGRGDLCVDLGAAPGGWTERLLARGARVVAVDPANMAPELQKHPKLRHVKDSAFAYEPDEPADWLFCDMAWRPLEVAALLAKWGRRGWASQLVANIKLPMNDKNPILHRVRFVLETHGGWKKLQIRQLYHDRDEVTVTAIH
ncbi:MAG: SAM-dependent methyltransferase [Myxococcaceae bacterium]